MSDNKEMHAWFSTIQKNNILDPSDKPCQYNKLHKLHTNIYLTENDKEVEVTEITYSKDDDHPKRFQDSKYIGTSFEDANLYASGKLPSIASFSGSIDFTISFNSTP